MNDDTHMTFPALISFALKESKNGASLTLCATCLALAKKTLLDCFAVLSVQIEQILLECLAVTDGGTSERPVEAVLF